MSLCSEIVEANREGPIRSRHFCYTYTDRAVYTVILGTHELRLKYKHDISSHATRNLYLFYHIITFQELTINNIGQSRLAINFQLLRYFSRLRMIDIQIDQWETLIESASILLLLHIMNIQTDQ